jgi:hypothetical protein
MVPSRTSGQETLDRRGLGTQDLVADPGEAVRVLRRIRRDMERGGLTGLGRDELHERRSVALAEGRAQGLPMVREHDEAIGPRGRRDRVENVAEAAIDLLRRAGGLRAAGAAMMGDLVIAGVVDVDDRPSHLDLVDHRPGREDPQRDVRDDPLEGVSHAARHPRPDVLTSLPPSLDDLGEELVDHLDDDPEVGPGISREGPSIGRTARRAVAADRGHREMADRRVAGQQVPDADARACQQPVAGRQPALDLGGVRCMIRDEQPIGRLLVPAEPGDCRVVAVENAGLAGGGARGQQGEPSRQGEPTRRDERSQDRHPPGGEHVIEAGTAEPVDLDDHESGFAFDVGHLHCRDAEVPEVPDRANR